MYRFTTIVLVTVFISSCTASISVPVATTLPTSKPSPTLILTVTMTPTTQPTQTPEPTATITVSLTFADWEKMFDLNYTYQPTGQQFDVLKEIHEDSEVLSDPKKVGALKDPANLIILYPNGSAQCMAKVDQAVEAAENGATILKHTTKNVTSPGNVCNWVLRAQNAAYLAGNHNVRMSFGETPRAPFRPGSFWIDKSDILVVEGSDSRLVAAILERPSHYLIGSPDVSEADSAVPTDTTEHWVEEVFEEDKSGIYVYTE